MCNCVSPVCFHSFATWNELFDYSCDYSISSRKLFYLQLAGFSCLCLFILGQYQNEHFFFFNQRFNTIKIKNNEKLQCLVYLLIISVPKEYNVKRLYTTKQEGIYKKESLDLIIVELKKKDKQCNCKTGKGVSCACFLCSFT